VQEKEKIGDISQRIGRVWEEEESTSQFARWFRMVCCLQMPKTVAKTELTSRKSKNELTVSISMTDIISIGY